MTLKTPNWFAFLAFSALLLLVAAACSGQNQSSAPPSEQNQPPAEAATPTSLAATGEVSVPAETNGSPPAVTSVGQAAALIDLRDLPQPEGITPLGPAEVGSLNYQVPLTVAEVVDFYRSLLTDQNWQELSDQGYSDEVNALLYFTQADFKLSLSASQMSEGTTMVSLLNHGNIDLKTLPQTTDAQDESAFPNILIYFSPTALSDVVAFTRQALADQGWHEYTPPGTALATDADSQTLTFIQNGLELTAFITIAPAQDGQSSVQYSTVLLPMDLPLTADASGLEFDKLEPYLSYNGEEGLESLVDFFRQTMSDTGWTELPDSASITENGATLAFAHEGEQMALLVEVLPTEDNQTAVTLRAFDSMSLDEAVANAEPTTEPTTEEAGASQEIGPSGAVVDNLLPDDAQEVAIEATDLSFSSPSPVETLVDFYRETLAADGWQEDTDFAQVDETFAYVEFTRADEAVALTVVNLISAREVSLDLSQAPSLLPAGNEAEEVSTGSPTNDEASPYTVNDWPTPPEATEVSLSGDILKYSIAWDLPTLAEFYRPTFELMELDTGCLDSVAEEEYTSISCSQSNGDLSLNFFAFEGFDQTEVEIDFTNSAVEASTPGDEAGDETEGLTAVDQDGLPLPSDHTGYSSENSTFRRGLIFTSPSDLKTLSDFFQAELPARGYEGIETSEDVSDAGWTFTGPDGNLILTLTSSGDETEGSLIIKNATAAAEAGILPPTGQARIYLVNLSDQALTVLLNDQTFEVPAGAGTESPDDAPMIDLSPNKTYKVTTKAGGSSVTDEVTVGEDEVWSLLLDVQGALPLQMY
ncbi:MAG TPA: hypothetical protein PKD98_21730 [Anaerolineae bacterium]|nr:hypothetical protein [Anaerolineae bacterium]